MDNMTPDEIAREYGLPTEAEQDAELESNPALLFTPAAGATVQVNVSIRNQTLTVTSPEGTVSDRISSGRHPYKTKTGCHSPKRTSKMHWSKSYGAWMPNSVFYYGGYAIHAGRLPGYPASHGCVRTTHKTSAHILALVQKYGSGATTICVN
jgi:hypothetical protein